MNLFVTGANGFVGTNLIRYLVGKGHTVSALVRSETKGRNLPDGVALVVGEATKPGPWQDSIAGHDVLINLAGASIFRRWTAQYKQIVRDSRILTTRNLVDAILADADPPVTLLSTSAVGYYGFTQDQKLGESAPPGDDFLSILAQDWENEALKARQKGARVAIMRFGVVLGSNGGALEQMSRPFRMFVGGPLGDGKQWFSWIHIDDLCRAAVFVAQRPNMEGPVNFVAPVALTNRDLSTAFGKALHRPSFMPAPGFMIRLALGEFGSVILNGQRVVPEALLEAGFEFAFPSIDQALEDLFSRRAA